MSGESATDDRMPIRAIGGPDDVLDEPGTGECGWCAFRVSIGVLSELDVSDEPGPEDALDVCPGCDPRTNYPLPSSGWSA